MDNFFVPSSWKRLWARLADQAIVLILFFPMWGFWYEMMDSEEIVWVPLSLFVFLLVFPMVYEAVFLALFQQTPGKWLMGLWVVPRFNCHAKLSPSHALLRALAGRLTLFFSWAPFALGLFKYDRTHLIDWFAETRVVQKNQRPRPARIRWILGSLLVVFYAFEGFNQAIYMYDSIDWESRRVDIQEAYAANMDPASLEDFGYDLFGDTDDDE